MRLPQIENIFEYMDMKTDLIRRGCRTCWALVCLLEVVSDFPCQACFFSPLYLLSCFYLNPRVFLILFLFSSHIPLGWRCTNEQAAVWQLGCWRGEQTTGACVLIFPPCPMKGWQARDLTTSSPRDPLLIIITNSRTHNKLGFVQPDFFSSLFRSWIKA